MTATTSAVSISFGFGFTHDLGPLCVNCRRREAHCASTRQCCPACTHWTGYDHNGDERAPGSTLPTCASEQGYQRHRTRHERACVACRDAHSRYNVQRRQQRRAS